MGLSLNTFYQTSIYITLIMFVFTLCFNFVIGLNIFGVMPGGSVISSDNTSGILSGLTSSPEYESGIGMTDIWKIVLSAGTIIAAGGALALAWLTQSTSIIAIYLYSVFFWSMYINTFSILYLGGLITGSLIMLVSIFSGVVAIIFIGAILGMLGAQG